MNTVKAILENRLGQMIIGGAAAVGSLVLADTVLADLENGKMAAVAIGWAIFGWLGLNRPGQK